jgi:hypothetical protein
MDTLRVVKERRASASASEPTPKETFAAAKEEPKALSSSVSKPTKWLWLGGTVVLLFISVWFMTHFVKRKVPLNESRPEPKIEANQAPMAPQAPHALAAPQAQPQVTSAQPGFNASDQEAHEEPPPEKDPDSRPAELTSSMVDQAPDVAAPTPPDAATPPIENTPSAPGPIE